MWLCSNTRYATSPPNSLRGHELGREAGHTVGVHTLHHRLAKPAFLSGQGAKYIAEELDPQIAAYAKIGHVPRAMSYPTSQRCPESDAGIVAGSCIRRFRGGHVVRFDPQGKFPKPDLVRTDEVFFPVEVLPTKVVLEGIGIGEAYRTDIDEIVGCINRAADRDEVLVTYSHDIRPDAKHISMKTEWLERILATAQARGLRIIGFDEIGP